MKNNKAIGADSVVNEFLKHGGSEVSKKLLKIVNMIFEQEEVPNDFRKTLIEPLYKKGDKSECHNYRDNSLVSVCSKLLTIWYFLDWEMQWKKVLREEECGFRKGRGCFDQIFSLRLTTEKCLDCQTPLVLGLIDYEQALYGISDK